MFILLFNICYTQNHTATSALGSVCGQFTCFFFLSTRTRCKSKSKRVGGGVFLQLSAYLLLYFYSSLLNAQYQNLALRSCQPHNQHRPNTSRRPRISLCLLLRVKRVISYLRSGRKRRRGKEGFLPLMSNLLEMDLQVWRDKGWMWSWKCLQPVTRNSKKRKRGTVLVVRSNIENWKSFDEMLV